MSDLVSLDECFLSVGEILALKCPALPADKGGMSKYIERHNWRWNKAKSRQRRGRGGGWEYHYSLLPQEAQNTFLTHRCFRQAEADYEARSESLWRMFDAATDAERAVARKRLDAVYRVYRLRGGGVFVKDAAAQVAREEGVRASAIFEWIKRTKNLKQADFWPALLAQRVGRTVTAACDPRVWNALYVDYLRPEQPAFGPCYQRAAEFAKANGLVIPSEKTLKRKMDRVPVAVRVLGRGGEAALDNLYPFQTRDKSGFAPLEAVNADGHRLDVFVKFDDGTIGRPVLLAIQDLYSGMIVGHRIGRNEDWPLVRLAFADMLENFGIPERVTFDNSRTFASKWISGRNTTRFRFKIKEDEPQGLLGSLGIEVRWTKPYSGRSKPIERAFRDLAEQISKHPACAGAYTGNSPSTKPANYGERAIPLAELEDLVTREIVRHNNRPGRRGGVTDGRSFAQTYGDALNGALLRETDAAAYDWLAGVDELDPLAVADLPSGRPPLSIVPDFSVSVVSATTPGGLTLPGLRFTWSAITDPTCVGILIQYRLQGGAAISELRIEDLSVNEAVAFSGIQANATYEARALLLTIPERGLSFSAWASASTATPSMIVQRATVSDSADAIAPEIVDFEHLSAQARFELQLVTGLAELGFGSLGQLVDLLRDAADRAAEADLNGQIESFSEGLARRATYTGLQIERRADLDASEQGAEAALDALLRVNNARVQIQVVQEVVETDLGAIKAQFTVAIDVNGKVVGLISLQAAIDGEGANSLFDVVADKFRVSQPGVAGGAPVEVFIVGTVNGAAAVGVKGDMFLDGTIVARHLSVNSLSAISANLGVVTAGLLRSADNKFRIDLNNKTISIEV